MKSVIVRLLGVAAIAITLSGCSAGVSIGQDPYHQAWYDVYGNYCGNGNPTSGCNFYANGDKIRNYEDPYYSSGNNYYYDFWTYTDSYGYHRSYTGYAWLSGTGILYDDYGNALNETGEQEITADVISQASAKEKQVSTAVGKALAQKYALAEDKGIMISKTLQDWAQLGRQRSRTESDMADISKRLYGVDASKAKNAIQQALASQSQQPIEELNVDVAAHWGTSPEVSKQILKGWYKDEVAAYGIK